MREIVFYNGYNLLVDILLAIVVWQFAKQAGFDSGYEEGYHDGIEDGINGFDSTHTERNNS